ncbi:MAG: competence/damage-inducible protein A [Bacteroidota bacterium]
MTAELITIGDELLIGQVVNTNAAYIAEQLNTVGIPVTRITTVGDEEKAVLAALSDAWKRSDLIIVTGGLGPTHDDITKKALCKFFNVRLILHEQTLQNIKVLLAKRNLPWTDLAKEQALVPRSATVIRNRLGTAPGMLFERNQKILIAMAGVPYEMKGIMEDFVVPYLRERSTGLTILHRTLNTTGIAEAFLFEQLGNIDEILRASSGKQTAMLAFLPSPQGVKLRITVQESSMETAAKRVEEIESRVRAKAERYIYSTDDETLEQVVGRLLTKRKLTIAIAESCTGGLIADRITNVAGSSRYFERGVIAYSDRSKVETLDVPPELIEKHGAVCREVAEAMAAGVRQIARTEIGISTTGIAGPTGGTPEKPVGLVWIGYADHRETLALRLHLGDDRLRVKERATQAALELVRRKVVKIE